LDCEVKRIEINEYGSRIYALRDKPDSGIIYFDINSKNKNLLFSQWERACI
jgi:hypothetical protein